MLSEPALPVLGMWLLKQSAVQVDVAGPSRELLLPDCSRVGWVDVEADRLTKRRDLQPGRDELGD
jgi:hypothetical protein